MSAGSPPPPGSAPYGPGGPYGSPAHGSSGSGAPPPYATAPRPGVVPLRHLGLGDIYGGALRTMRRSPRATVGMAAVVSFVFLLLPMLGSVLYGALDLGTTRDALAGGSSDPAPASSTNTAYDLLSYSSNVLGGLAAMVITGLMTRVVASAVVGRPMTAGEAWARTRGRLPALLGLSLLTGLGLLLIVGVPVGVGVLVGVAAESPLLAVLLGLLLGLVGLLVALALYTACFLLAPPALVLEDRGVFSSIGRARQLARGQFWRLLGIVLLTVICIAVVGFVIAIPLGIVSVVATFTLLDSSWGPALVLIGGTASSILSYALISPFFAGVVALQYVDQRFRKDGLDLTLLEQGLADRSA